MDGKLVTDLLPGNAGDDGNIHCPPFRYTDTFNEIFPFYLSIGMTPEQFWDQDCTLVKSYREAFELREKRQSEMLWLEGAYIYEILLDVAPLYRTFKPKKPKPYRKEPIYRQEEKKKSKEEAEIEQMKVARAEFRGMVERFNREFLKKQEGGEQDGRNGEPKL